MQESLPAHRMSRPRTPWISRFLAALLAGTGVSQAAVLLEVGTIQLLPGEAGQSASIYLRNTGSQAVSIGDLNLFLQVGDGEAGSGPAMTSVDLLSNTIYSGFSASVLPDPGNTSQFQWLSLTLPSSLAIAPEIAGNDNRVRVAELVFNTQGVAEGEYSFAVADTLFGDSELFDPFDVPLSGFSGVNGRLVVGPQAGIPEPESWATIVVVGLGAMAWVRRRRH